MLRRAGQIRAAYTARPYFSCPIGMPPFCGRPPCFEDLTGSARATDCAPHTESGYRAALSLSIFARLSRSLGDFPKRTELVGVANDRTRSDAGVVERIVELLAAKYEFSAAVLGAKSASPKAAKSSLSPRATNVAHHLGVDAAAFIKTPRAAPRLEEHAKRICAPTPTLESGDNVILVSP